MDDEFEEFSSVKMYNRDLQMFEDTDKKEIGGAERWIDLV
jgi:hypothetical protein